MPQPSFSKALIQQNISGVFQGGLLSQKAYDKAYVQVDSALQALRNKGSQGQLPMLETPFSTEDMLPLRTAAQPYQKFSKVLVFGTGGSSLGGRTLTSLAQSWVRSDTAYPVLYFLDNLDPETFWEVMSIADPQTTGVLVISQSGETPETLIQLMRCIDYWKASLSPEQLSQRITVITASQTSSLGQIAKKWSLPHIPLPSDISGRFSCFTAAGLLPAMIAGINPQDVRHGAGYIVNQVFAQSVNTAAVGAAVMWALFQKQKISLHVMMPYGDIFSAFSLWHRQLVAESLGKEGRGFTPIHGSGPADQHSQLQLYLNGPRDKFFTLVYERQTARERTNRNLWADHPALSSLAHASISDLVHAQMMATTHSLVHRGCPIRTISVASLTEVTLGALLMHFMLEVLILSQLLDIDPFSQPTVKANKKAIQHFLSQPDPQHRQFL